MQGTCAFHTALNEEVQNSRSSVSLLLPTLCTPAWSLFLSRAEALARQTELVGFVGGWGVIIDNVFSSSDASGTTNDLKLKLRIYGVYDGRLMPMLF